MNTWPTTRLGDICEKITDGTHHSPANYPHGDFKYVTAKNIKPWGLDLTDITYVDAITHREIYSRCDVRKGDVLYVKDGATTGRVVLNTLDEEFSLLSSVGVLRPGPAARPKYLLYALQETGIRDRMLADVAGVAITRLTLRKLNDAKIPLAPLRCQDRIVEKLEELLSDLDAGVAELKAAQKKLGQYRQSLLKAAVEGALTAEWRNRNRPAESGAQLLERILRERRARWEAKQFARFKEQGKTPPKGWRDKYPEPVQPDTSELPGLPEGWVWASLDQLAAMVRNGLSQKPSSEPIGYPILRINAVRAMAVNLDEVRYLAISEQEAAEYILENGDLLATRYNGSVDLLGVVGLIRGMAAPTVHPDKLIRIKPLLASTLGEWMEACAASGASRRHVVSRVKTTAGQTGISGEDIKKMPIPLAPLAEQATATEMLAATLREIAEQGNAIEASLAQSAAQRKNILKAAFSGQLVPQDPGDEPAGVLLERIRAGRAGRSGEAKRRGRKARKAT